MSPCDRTPEHERWERETAAMGTPYPEPIRSLRVTIDGIRYQIFTAILSWQAPEDDCLLCERCGYYLQLIAPNLLHNLPLARCKCASSFMEAIDPRDQALLELAHPVSEQDAKLAEDFQREIGRLTAAESKSAKP